LDDGVPQGAGLGVRRVVAGVRDHVDPTVPSADRILAEADGAVGEPLPVRLPIRVAAPAVVDGVAGSA